MKETMNYKNRENNDLKLLIENPMYLVLILIAGLGFLSAIVRSCESEQKTERLKIEQDSIRKADSIRKLDSVKAEENYRSLLNSRFFKISNKKEK